jgi:hypothetical protein
MQALNAFSSALPGWLIAAILIAVGWLAAGAARLVVTRLLAFLHFNQLCMRTGVADVLRKGEVVLTPAELVGRGLYWVVLIGVFLETARLLDLGVTAELRQRALAALPALLGAIIVLAVGLLAVAFLAGLMRTLIRNAGSAYANLWSRIIRWAGTIVVLAIAVEQAEIRGSAFVGVLYIVIAAFAFGTALAFGLGCKDMARNAMEKWIAALKERHRDSSKPDMEG